MVDKSDKDNLRFSYDTDVDVLYMSIGMPQEVIGEMDNEGIIVEFDPAHSNKILGITILDFQKRFSSSHTKSLPVNMIAELQIA